MIIIWKLYTFIDKGITNKSCFHKLYDDNIQTIFLNDSTKCKIYYA